jgi:hypothetical protein
VYKALSVLDASDASHNAKDMSQEKVCGMVLPMKIIGPSNKNLEEATNCKTPAKSLEKTESTKACKARFFEGKLKFPGSFGHTSQYYPMGSFVK